MKEKKKKNQIKSKNPTNTMKQNKTTNQNFRMEIRRPKQYLPKV